MNERRYTAVDTLITNVDNAIRTIFGRPQTTERPNPAANIEETDMTAAEKKHAAGLMRVNHAGEVSAQFDEVISV